MPSHDRRLLWLAGERSPKLGLVMGLAVFPDDSHLKGQRVI